MVNDGRAAAAFTGAGAGAAEAGVAASKPPRVAAAAIATPSLWIRVMVGPLRVSCSVMCKNEPGPPPG